VRAASFTDLYTNLPDVLPGPPAGGVPNWWIQPSVRPSTAINDFATVIYPANFALNPEVGNTLTAGIVLQPKGFLSGLRLSVDYYRIDLKGAIGVLTANEVAAACFDANSFCDKILAADGTPFSSLSATDPKRADVGTVIRGAANIGSLLQEGWDIELLYSLQLDRIVSSLPGQLTLRGVATMNDKMVVDPNTTDAIAGVDYHNQTGGSAFSGFTAPSKYILTTYATYDLGGFSITWDAKYIPKGIYDVRKSTALPYTDGFSINNNDVGARLYIGLSTSYKFDLAGGDQNAEFFLSIRNLFDRDPPPTASNINGSSGYVSGNGGPTNPVFYDTLGARWRAGVRVNF
jgi:iron complex outermembrane recepter protein